MRDLKNRLSKARGACHKNEKDLELQEHHKKNETEAVQNTSGDPWELLYGCETWKMQ